MAKNENKSTKLKKQVSSDIKKVKILTNNIEII